MKTLLYPKIYATVIRVVPKSFDDKRPDRIFAIDDEGRRYDLALKYRRGYGHCGCRGFDFGKGTRIKVYKRNGIFRFAKVGS